MKKKTIIISVISALVIAAAAAITVAAISINSRSHVDFKLNNDNIGLEEPAQISALLKDIRPGDEDGASQNSSGNDNSEDEMLYDVSRIPAVTGLMRLGGQEDSINLVWSEFGGVNGFKVYRRTSGSDGAYTLFSTVKRANLEIRNLSQGCKYDFKVAAFITDGSGTYEGPAAEATFATEPKSVSGFKLADADEDSVTLKWKAVEDADGYSMQRCFGGEWSDYKTFDADTTEFTDEDLKSGKAYYYRICSYREDSDGFLYSETKDVYTFAGLIAPEDTGSESRIGRVSLDYSSVDYADGYEIYFSDDNKTFKLIDDIDSTFYNSDRLTDGEVYYFRVCPYHIVDGDKKLRGPYLSMDFTANTDIYDEEVGDTYVEVCIEDQHMWYIKDGEIYLESDIVSGNRYSMDTPKGFYSVLGKTSPCTLTGEDYVSYVDYWMPFIGGAYGLHDASWRSSFGGSIYEGDGSHGCVNLPTDIAEELYDTIEIGTPVIIY